MRRALSVAFACCWLVMAATGTRAEPRAETPAQTPQSPGIWDLLRDRLRDHLVRSTEAEEKAAPAAALARLGGSRLILQASTEKIQAAMLDDLRGEVRRLMREARLGYSSLAVRDGSVEMHMRERSDVPRALAALAATAGPNGDAVGLNDMGEGSIQLTPTASNLGDRFGHALDETIAVVRRRLQELGVPAAGAEHDGADRIAVVLPGVKDPVRIADALIPHAQLAFRLIDVSVDAATALKSGPPPGSEVLYGFKTKEPFVVKKQVEIGGEEIADASATFDSHSNNNPIISFRFTVRGTRAFALITQENVGQPFAIVLDREVIAAPVIREPILGGSGQISGGFTPKEADDLALRMRAGALPVGLTVVEQQAVAPAQK